MLIIPQGLPCGFFLLIYQVQAKESTAGIDPSDEGNSEPSTLYKYTGVSKKGTIGGLANPEERTVFPLRVSERSERILRSKKKTDSGSVAERSYSEKSEPKVRDIRAVAM